MRLFIVLQNFPFTTSETMGDYYLQTWYIRVASRVAKRIKTEILRKLGNVRKVSKPHRMIAQCPPPPPKTAYTEKNHPTTRDPTHAEARSRPGGMNTPPYKQFALTKWNTPLCQDPIQARRLIRVGWFFKYK